MIKKEQYKRIITFIIAISIITIETAIFAHIWYNYYNSITFWNKGNLVLIGIYFIILLAFSNIYGASKIGYLKIIDALYSNAFSMICTNIITYFQIMLIGRWKFGTNFLPILYMIIIDLITIIIWITISKLIYHKIYPPRKTLLICEKHNSKEFIKKIKDRKDIYRINEKIYITQEIATIKNKINKYSYVIIDDIPIEIRDELLKYCFEKEIQCYCIPKISDIMIMNMDKIHLFDTPIFVLKNMHLQIEQRFVKRLIDILLSLIAIILLLPIMIVISIIIKAYDKGPILYKQKRLTLNRKEFYIYKFRSMKVKSESKGARLSSKNDERITPIGKILRNLHLDELPQLVNVLIGDMSLVGPRPERPEIADFYKTRMKEFDYRLKVKAGLTGYAQVYGKYNTTPFDKLKLDLTYIENYSILLDIKILLITFKILFQKENTEGIDEDQITAVKESEDE